MSARSIARGDVLALIAAATCWGLGTVISKAALEEIPPLILLPIQLAASVTVLLVLMRLRGMPLRSGAPPLLGRLGLLNPGLAYALSLVGLLTITASMSVLLWAFEPLMILGLAAWFLKERITPRLALLSIAAVVGMVVVVDDPSSGGELLGIGLTVAGVGACAVYTIIARRFLPGAPETSQVVLAQQVHALGFAAAVAVGLAVIRGLPPLALTPAGLASAIGSGVLYYAGAYWFYLGALRRVPASRAIISFYLIPIVGLAASYLLLGERLEPRQWAGVALVLASVLAIVWQPAAEADATEPGATAAAT